MENSLSNVSLSRSKARWARIPKVLGSEGEEKVTRWSKVKVQVMYVLLVP